MQYKDKCVRFNGSDFPHGDHGAPRAIFESSPSWQTAQPEESPANYTEGTFKELMKDVEELWQEIKHNSLVVSKVLVFQSYKRDDWLISLCVGDRGFSLKFCMGAPKIKITSWPLTSQLKNFKTTPQKAPIALTPVVCLFFLQRLKH